MTCVFAVAAKRRGTEPEVARQVAAPVKTQAKTPAVTPVTAPVRLEFECVALIKQPTGSIAVTPCSQTVAGMREGGNIAKGDLGTPQAALALAKPALPVWNTKLVKPVPHLVVQMR